mmetsp:Transcript_47299/g.34587  ORF Transcript_47299/g.34587 Transcript_47299/m.34587 type:complete len:233 (+) Transcript_47299:690-1388(+)
MVADDIAFTNDALDYFFVPFRSDAKWQKIESQLKRIETEFLVPPSTTPQAFSGIIDQNFLNCFLYQLTSNDKQYSLREMLSRDPKMALVKQMLTTTTVALLLPSFKEEYGEGKMIDMVGTVSDQFVADKIERSSGVKLDENGNLKVQIDLGAQIIVEEEPGKWTPARDFYVTLTAKIKMIVNQTSETDEPAENETTKLPPGKYFYAYVKGLEITTLKMFKGDEEQTLEQMLT